jgi:four helix bundle protein
MPPSLRDLRLYQECRKFIFVIYRLTKILLDDERFGLISQLRRAVVSILANLIEGYSRNSVKDRLHFYNIALGSFREVECYILILGDLEYINSEQSAYLIKIKDKIGGMLIQFIKSVSL